MGITDIDDKILTKAAQEGAHPMEIAGKYELSFLDDMQMLEVLPPIAYLKVSDHIPEIQRMIERIEQNGLAYQDDKGNIWFDTEAMGERYGKLRDANFVPETSQVSEHSGKRNAVDFALWKSNSGAFGWDWRGGVGRPGWHIECSAMASYFFGKGSETIGIHSGGIDLKFPHHTNEIAQCEACFGTNDGWAKLWIHTGHLYIRGHKMSKSLKNFITIKDFLRDHSAEDLRMFCLMHKYRESIDYSSERIEEAAGLISLFQKILHRIRHVKKADSAQLKSIRIIKWTEADIQLSARLSSFEENFIYSLADDFNTPKAISELRSLASETDRYLTAAASSGSRMPSELLENISYHIARPLQILGFSSFSEFCSSKSTFASEINAATWDTLSEFRHEIRLSALDSMSKLKQFKSSKDSESCSAVISELCRLSSSTLTSCDALRRRALLRHSIQLEDSKSGSSWFPRSSSS